MARTSVLFHVAAALQAAPLVGALVRRTGLAGPRAWVAAWLAAGIVTDAAMVALRRAAGNNLWLLYLALPVMGMLALAAAAAWQSDPVRRTAIRLMAPLSLLVWLVVLRVEDARSFSRVVGPMYALLCLGAALLTLATRGIRDEAPLLRSDWFWVCLGLALYYGAAAARSPLAAALVDSRPDLVARAYTLQAWVNIVAYLLITTGFVCRPTPSGVSSPPSLSAWGSSSSPSAPAS